MMSAGPSGSTPTDTDAPPHESMRTILLGPQRFQVTAPAALRSLGVDGPVATINSGWEEREDAVTVTTTC